MEEIRMISDILENDREGLMIPLQIAIGEIEISIENCINLEKEDCFSVDLPQRESVQLLLAGEPVAHAEFKLEGDQIKLKIIEVLLQQELENSDNDMKAEAEKENLISNA